MVNIYLLTLSYLYFIEIEPSRFFLSSLKILQAGWLQIILFPCEKVQKNKSKPSTCSLCFIVSDEAFQECTEHLQESVTYDIIIVHILNGALYFC